jgi:hypothetical protein
MQGQPPKADEPLTAEDKAEDLEIKKHLIALLESDSSDEDEMPGLVSSSSSSDEAEDDYRITNTKPCQQLLAKKNKPLQKVRVEDPVYRFLKRSNMYLRTKIDAGKVREDRLHEQLSAMKKGSSANVVTEQITRTDDEDDGFSSEYNDIPVELLQAELERRQRALTGISAKRNNNCTP